MINWAENLYYSNGMGQKRARAETKDIKIFATVLNTVMLFLECGLLVGYCVAIKLASPKILKSLAVTQLSFHALCAFLIVLCKKYFHLN